MLGQSWIRQWRIMLPTHGNNNAIYCDDTGGDGTLIYGNVFRDAGGRGGVFLQGSSDVRIINNIFINRKPLHIRPQRFIDEKLCEARVKAVANDQSPWREKYPDFVNYLEERKQMPRGNVFLRNLIVNAPLDTKFKCVQFEENLVVSREPDLKHVSITGFEQIPFDKIGINKQ